MKYLVIDHTDGEVTPADGIQIYEFTPQQLVEFREAIMHEIHPDTNPPLIVPLTLVKRAIKKAEYKPKWSKK